MLRPTLVGLTCSFYSSSMQAVVIRAKEKVKDSARGFGRPLCVWSGGGEGSSSPSLGPKTSLIQPWPVERDAGDGSPHLESQNWSAWV